ncbi:hypothetical protein ACUIJ5_02910 [Bacillus toyonensis]
MSRKSGITAKDRKDAGRKALKSAVVKGWINVGKWGLFGDMVAFMDRYYTGYKNYNLKRKEKEGLIAALLFGSGAINLLIKVKGCVKSIIHKKTFDF